MRVLRFSLPLVACAVAFCAADFWNTKDYTQWTSEEIDRILQNSPWAKDVKVAYDSSGMNRGGGMGREGGGGGMGRRGGIGIGGPIGIGLPGGIGGRGRGGMGGPGGSPRGQGGMPSMTVLVRWESAQPVRQAQKRLEDSKTAADPSPDHYVISVTGLRMPERRSNASDDDGQPRGGRDPEQMRDQLMYSTRLVRKTGETIRPDDVKIVSQVGANEIQFLFPRTHPLSLDDKEVTFHTQMGPMKVEKKFELNQMKFKGKLEL